MKRPAGYSDLWTRRHASGGHAAVSPLCPAPAAGHSNGFTLIELVMALTVLTVLTLGVIPLVKVSVTRQREQRLREALREMRVAIEQFHREALLGCPSGATGVQPQPGQPPVPLIDPRVRVKITDCTIFGVDNPDLYPPDLETLVNGVNVAPMGGPSMLGGAGLEGSRTTATEVGRASTKKKVYLRAIPVDPITGKAEWDLRSSYDSADATSWGGENVFDVRSKSSDAALNGEKYSDW